MEKGNEVGQREKAVAIKKDKNKEKVVTVLPRGTSAQPKSASAPFSYTALPSVLLAF